MDKKSLKGKRVVDLSREELAEIATEAGNDAVKETLVAGLPVTGSRNGKIIKFWADGREEVLK